MVVCRVGTPPTLGPGRAEKCRETATWSATWGKAPGAEHETT